MRIVLQRVNQAQVSVDEKVIGKIGKGYMLLVGFGPDDTEDPDPVNPVDPTDPTDPTDPKEAAGESGWLTESFHLVG